MPYLLIIRPINFFFVILTTIFGAVYPEFAHFDKRIIFASFSAALISAAGYVVNDYFDRYIDKINRPDRMIPTGKISPYNAYMYGMLLFILGLVLSFFTATTSCILIAFLNTFLLFFYAKIFKNKYLIGNFIVAYAAASTFLYGALVSNNLKNIFPLLIVAFLFTLIREFIKDAQDYSGDKKFGAKTIAVVIGKKKTIIISLYVAVFSVILILVLFLYKIISLKLTILLIAVNFLPVIFVLKDLLAKITDKNFHVTSNFLKFEMFLVILIFYFGR